MINSKIFVFLSIALSDVTIVINILIMFAKGCLRITAFAFAISQAFYFIFLAKMHF